ncbi:hypothetical protein FQZ97_685860 [compost metagenome]
MEKFNQQESYVLSQTKPIDWIAVESLQKKRTRTKNEFYIDSIEYAIESALKSPIRLATGEQLAKDLFRDGKRVISSIKGLTGKNLINRETFEYLEPKFDFQSEVNDSSIYQAIDIVKSAFFTLSQKEAFSLYIRAVGITDSTDIHLILGVSVRQYRNLLNQARLKLKAYLGFTEAYFLLFINSDEADIKEFFNQLINGMFNNKLS